ncbi:terminal uridylyltransferase 7 isoform X1 [Alligator mississippiensis]|uniref:RNA uridylyltransferase n=1 Tax=Alligator mississippiensis TaxID=8496 RepID=A0A151M885_ALLMI|nr:terminal uridylyltransferase 7 isoform X1 [Alligator mississippiensis]KYO20715.1 terminal uridylyltransferase 4 isoform B [Alligator mississippiensis]
MGDAVKPSFAKRNKERGISNEDELRRNPVQQDFQVMDDYGNNHGNKTEMGFQKKKGPPLHYGNSPRKGAHSVLSSPNSFKSLGHSQGAKLNDAQKDQIKKWISDDHRGTSENWREYKSTVRIPMLNRTRKDSFQEVEGTGSRSVRRQQQKDLTGEEISDVQKGNSEMKKHRKPRRSRRTTRKEDYEQDEDMEGPVIDESVLSVKERLGLQQAEERLKRDCIYRLKKRPRNYPAAKYTCKLCDALIESVAFAHKHIKEKRHKKNMEEKQEEQLLTTLPPPTPSQIQAIGVAIGNVVQEFGLNNEDLEQRSKINIMMETLLHQKLPECSLRLYGSSGSRFGFKNSDINIDIQFPASMAQPDVLLVVQESLKNSESFIDVDADFHARVPVVVCKEKQSGLVCKISAGNENAHLTTNHLATLGKLEPTLVPLVIAFRYWAKLCCVDRPEEGGLPPYVFALMVIFFLQQRKEPLLPVYFGSWIGGFSLNKLMIFNLKKVENYIVVWEQNPVDDSASPKEASPKKGKVPLVFDLGHQCSAPIGQLWVELFRFYALEFNLADLVISIRLKEAVSRESKDWPKKRIAVEDPYSVKRNVARTLNSQLVYEYILHCLRATYKYFALPHKKSSSSSKKTPLNANTEISRKLKPEKNAIMHDTANVQNLSDKTEKVLAGDYINNTNVCSDIPQAHTIDPSKLFDGSESLTEEELAEDIGHLEITQEDSDCVIEEIISGDNEDFKPSCEETESGNEEEDEEEEEHEQERKWPNSLVAVNQDLDEDSENGDLPITANERDIETCNISDVEGFQNTAVTESDEYGLKCSGILDEKADIDEESTEGTDELDESLNKFAPSVQDQISEINNSDDEDEEEEQSLVLNQTKCGDILTVEGELDNTYAGSGDEEALSEEEEELSIPVKYEDKQLEENVEESLLVDLSKEDITEKGSTYEGSTTVEQLIESEFFYEFNRLIFTKGKSPTVVCSLCKREGHLKRDCPEDFKKIELDPLPALTPKFSNILDQVCIQCYQDFAPNIIEDQAREHIRQNLESFIRKEFSGTRLNLFGSSKNGFGFKQSDLDICMTIDGRETAEGLDCIRIIEELAKVLKKQSGLRNVLPITTAKVPIVKFIHARSGLEVDISLYNTLALHNTRLLSSYAAIDPRVKYLCYTMKVFTKMCDIGDASRGSLSSYAYTLMVLYFLQQRNPPVIPVLQEIYSEPKKPEILVDGWNVYFFDRIEELPAVWPDYHKNTESVGQLWLGLLRFYTEEFDFKEHVICIRRKSLLTTFKKQWTSKYIVIEDPFDLNHNLGAGLSRKMTNFIMKAFINGRRVFGTPIKGFPKEYPSKMEYFFDPEVLTEGELAPNDRCCRICGKIGHFMKDCPMRRKVRRLHDHEDIRNQRYPENKEKRSKEDKELQNKTTEKDTSVKEGKMQLGASQKNKLGKGTVEMGKDKNPRQSAEKWKRQEDRDLREKRCFICGKEGHIKKECPHYKGPAGCSKSEVLCGSPSSPGAVKHAGRLNQGMLLHEEKKKQKGKVFLSPQSGSLSNKYMTQGKASQKRTQQES